MPVDAADFRRALGQFASGVTVVTTRTAAGQPQGLTVSSFCSVSLDPPLVLVCVDKRCDATPALAASRAFAVSVLAEDQEQVSQRFAFAGPGKFDGYAAAGAGGPLLIPGALAHVVCRLVAVHDAGDHLIFVGQVESLSARPGRPLLYHASRYHRLPRQGDDLERDAASAAGRAEGPAATADDRESGVESVRGER